MNGGYRYTGQGSGLMADLGFADAVPDHAGANAAVGATSARVKGSVDLNPNLTGATRLTDMNGARSLRSHPRNRAVLVQRRRRQQPLTSPVPRR